MRLLPCGDRAILVELPDASARRRLDEVLSRTAIPGIVEHVPAARTVLVTVTGPAALVEVSRALRCLDLSAEVVAAASDDQVVEIPVRYDGPDLGSVATHLGVSTDEVVARHTEQVWRVEFAGFTPGFGYLLGDRVGLTVPRLTVPRTRVPAGAVALADEWSGVYPRASSGGWQLIGTTDLAMWDAHRQSPARLTPGRLVRFTSLASGSSVAAASEDADATESRGRS